MNFLKRKFYIFNVRYLQTKNFNSSNRKVYSGNSIPVSNYNTTTITNCEGNKKNLNITELNESDLDSSYETFFRQNLLGECNKNFCSNFDIKNYCSQENISNNFINPPLSYQEYLKLDNKSHYLTSNLETGCYTPEYSQNIISNFSDFNKSDINCSLHINPFTNNCCDLVTLQSSVSNLRSGVANKISYQPNLGSVDFDYNTNCDYFSEQTKLSENDLNNQSPFLEASNRTVSNFNGCEIVSLSKLSDSCIIKDNCNESFGNKTKTLENKEDSKFLVENKTDNTQVLVTNITKNSSQTSSEKVNDNSLKPTLIDKEVNTESEIFLRDKGVQFTLDLKNSNLSLDINLNSPKPVENCGTQEATNSDLEKSPIGTIDIGVQTCWVNQLPIFNKSQVDLIEDKDSLEGSTNNINISKNNGEVRTVLKSLGQNNFELITSASNDNSKLENFNIKAPISRTTCENNYYSLLSSNIYDTPFNNQLQFLTSYNFDNNSNQNFIYPTNFSPNLFFDFEDQENMYNPLANQQNAPGFTAIPITANTVSSSLSPNKWVPREALNLSEYEARFLPKWVTIRDSVQPPIIMQPCRISHVNTFTGLPCIGEIEETPTVTINPPISSSCQYCCPHYQQCIMPIPGSQLDYYKIPNYWYMAKPHTTGVGFSGESNFL